MRRANPFAFYVAIVALLLPASGPVRAGRAGAGASADGRVALDYVADGIVRGGCATGSGNVFFEVVAVGAEAKSRARGEVQDFGTSAADWEGFCARILDGNDGSWLGGIAGDARCGLIWSGVEEPNEVYFADFPVSSRYGDAATTACFRAVYKQLSGYDEVAARLLFGYLGQLLQDGGRRPPSEH